MRTTDQGGRFTISFEQQSMFAGIDADLRTEVGATILWVVYDAAGSTSDEIYDVGANTAGGRRWLFPPIRIPAYMAVIYQGAVDYSDRGFYQSDILRVSVAMNVIEQIFPELVWAPDPHINDRILYRGNVYRPTRSYLRGQLRDTHTIFTVDATQVNPEEYVNDPDLLSWVNRADGAAPWPMPHAPQLQRRRTT